MLTGQSVLITDETGLIIDIIDKKTAGDDIQVFEGLLSPGFINCHCHLELSHLYGHIPEQTGLVDFILKVVNERYFDEAKILGAIEGAENQMLQNGIVAVGDICNNSLTLAQKKAVRSSVGPSTITRCRRCSGFHRVRREAPRGRQNRGGPA